MRYETTIAMARGLVHRARHAEIERLLADPVVYASGRDNVIARTLLVRSRLLGGAGQAGAASILTDRSAGRRGDMSDGMDAASRAEITVWQGWLAAWPRVSTFRPATAIDLFRRAVALGRLADDPATISWSYIGSALVYRVMRLPVLSLAAIDRAEEVGWHHADCEAAAWLAGLSVINELQLGDLEEARRQMRQFSTAVDGLISPLYDARRAIVEARTVLEIDGDASQAITLASHGLAILESGGYRQNQAFAEGCLVSHDALVRLGDRSEAIVHLDRAEDLADTQVGLSARLRRRRERLEASVLVHTLSRWRSHEKPDPPPVRLPADLFWGPLPHLRVLLEQHALLITGERGSGKLHAARELHRAYAADDESFVVIDCDAAGVGLNDQAQLTEALHGPRPVTVVLRHVEHISRPMADRLVAILSRKGEDVLHRDSLRVIATTSISLAECVIESGFSDELFQRLSICILECPPLRKSPARVENLTWTFVDEFAGGVHMAPSVTDAAMGALRSYDWPGNIRQLRNEIQRIVASMAGEPAPIVDLKDLPVFIREHSVPDTRESTALDAALARTERDIIAAVLARHGGQVASAADELGLTRQGLYKKMKRLGVDVRRWPPEPDRTSISSN